MLNKLRRIFTLERIVWGAATLLLSAVFLVIGLTAPALPDFGTKETVKVIYSDKTSSTENATEQTSNIIIGASSTPSDESSAEVSGKIPLNSATKEQLMSVAGIGEVFAQRILDYRDDHGGFADLAELKEIEGVGETRYANWKSYFTLD